MLLVWALIMLFALLVWTVQAFLGFLVCFCGICERVLQLWFLWYLHLCGILIHVQIHVQILIRIKSQPCELAEHCNFLKVEHQFALNFKA